MESNIVLIKALMQEFSSTGILVPSSKALSRALTDELLNYPKPLNIIEVGAGTGPITKIILKRLKPEDKLTICELNSNLLSVLKKNLNSNPNFNQHRENIDFFEGPIQELEKEGEYDYIVCSLPFLNFNLELVEEIFEKFYKIAKQDAGLSFFSYLGFKTASKQISKSRKERLTAIEGFFKSQNYFECKKKKNVWFNLMPAYVNYLRRNA